MSPVAWTDTERNWVKAVALVAGSVLLFAALEALELGWGRESRHDRMVYHPVETSMRCLAIPHFLIAFLFTTTSSRMRGALPWARLAGLAAVGAGLCWLFHATGGRDAKIPKALFLAYFAVHEFRDEAFFYVANGDAPEGVEPDRLKREVLVAPALLLFFGVAVVFLGAAWEIGGLRRYTEPVFGASGIRWAAGPLPLLAVGAFVWWLLRRARARGGAWAFVRTHRPVFVVFGGIFLLILLDLVLHGKVRAIVTLHVTAWYVFTMHALARRPPPTPTPRTLSWRWMRTTRPGFAFLHVGLFVLVAAGCALWAYGFDNTSSPAWALLSRDAFPYWTIMHITMSFLPR